MTGPEHYRAAERLLEETHPNHVMIPQRRLDLMRQAHIHALLAAAAAVGGLDLAYTRWGADREGWKGIVSPGNGATDA